jgi:hypothetical protein
MPTTCKCKYIVNLLPVILNNSLSVCVIWTDARLSASAMSRYKNAAEKKIKAVKFLACRTLRDDTAEIIDPTPVEPNLALEHPNYTQSVKKDYGGLDSANKSKSKSSKESLNTSSTIKKSMSGDRERRCHIDRRLIRVACSCLFHGRIEGQLSTTWSASDACQNALIQSI